MSRNTPEWEDGYADFLAERAQDETFAEPESNESFYECERFPSYETHGFLDSEWQR